MKFQIHKSTSTLQYIGNTVITITYYHTVTAFDNRYIKIHDEYHLNPAFGVLITEFVNNKNLRLHITTHAYYTTVCYN